MNGGAPAQPARRFAIAAISRLGARRARSARRARFLAAPTGSSAAVSTCRAPLPTATLSPTRANQRSPTRASRTGSPPSVKSVDHRVLLTTRTLDGRCDSLCVTRQWTEPQIFRARRSRKSGIRRQRSPGGSVRSGDLEDRARSRVLPPQAPRRSPEAVGERCGRSSTCRRGRTASRRSRRWSKYDSVITNGESGSLVVKAPAVCIGCVIAMQTWPAPSQNPGHFRDCLFVPLDVLE